MRSNTLTAEHVVIESHLDGSDNNDGDLHNPDILSDNKNPMSPIDDDILENELTHSNFKRKNKETINENANFMHDMQLQMFTIIQEMQTKINELYDAIGEAIYAAIKKTKYPTNEHLMKICYDTLLDIKEDTIHSEFSDLVKPKTGNRQVTHEEERKFKEADITKESYLKLNQPVDANDDLHYTYLNLIIDRIFADPNTEKNSIAFGMAVALNYLDPSKGISMVPSEVAERMNNILEKMQVSDCEEL
ncbi:2572_t:CDS:2 [Cetraspora pellucida]|uniref:2572_t:CDS:1 n=1 Tax=Cetraspora pellucida TaxID=1433469 RepID=A0ACA9NIT8_9GLOM|nr:2572_t:CDS:2 [Cetraspora pellucida]